MADLCQIEPIFGKGLASIFEKLQNKTYDRPLLTRTYLRDSISGKGLAGIFTIVQDALLQAAGWSHWRRQ